MHSPRRIVTILLSVLCISLPTVLGIINPASSSRATSRTKYARAHSLGENYTFHARDGWQSVNVTDLQYKYRRDTHLTNFSSGGHMERRGGENSDKKPFKPNIMNSGLGGAVGGVVSDIWKGLKGLGKAKTVTITWYTGHDLKNPSCWANGRWAPTDESFACALTLKGWEDRPKCFKFIELCNTPKKCVFVRVVDTCAGCAAGSRHVDLTKAAFGQLADFDEGILNVQLREATEPAGWYEDLWGPKHNKNNH